MNVIDNYLNFQTNYTDFRWKWLKIPFIIFWLFTASTVLFEASDLIMPTSICRFFDCSIFLSFTAKIVSFFAMLFLVILYVLEIKMLYVTAFLSFLSILIFTMEDSHGIYNRNDILSGILIAQFAAYVLFQLNKSNDLLFKNRIFFSQQMVLAIYFLSGISKIISSGFFWFLNTELFALQVHKANMNKYIDFKNEFYIEKAERLTAFILSNPNITALLLFLTLLIEISVIVTLFMDKKWLVYYGVLLLLLHVGIWVFMSIMITPIIVVNLIFLVNVFYFLFSVPFKSYQKSI